MWLVGDGGQALDRIYGRHPVYLVSLIGRQSRLRTIPSPSLSLRKMSRSASVPTISSRANLPSSPDKSSIVQKTGSKIVSRGSDCRYPQNSDPSPSRSSCSKHSAR